MSRRPGFRHICVHEVLAVLSLFDTLTLATTSIVFRPSFIFCRNLQANNLLIIHPMNQNVFDSSDEQFFSKRAIVEAVGKNPHAPPTPHSTLTNTRDQRVLLINAKPKKGKGKQ